MIETPPGDLKDINDSIQNFISEGKTDKISQNTSIKNIDEGHFKLCHHPTKVDALKQSWTNRLCTDTKPTRKTLPNLFCT